MGAGVLLFKLVLPSGVVKATSGDPAWLSVARTRLPFRNAVHSKPACLARTSAGMFLQLGVAATFTELPAMLLIIAPHRTLRTVGAALQALLTIIATGNHFLQLLDDCAVCRCWTMNFCARLTLRRRVHLFCRQQHRSRYRYGAKATAAVVVRTILFGGVCPGCRKRTDVHVLSSADHSWLPVSIALSFDAHNCALISRLAPCGRVPCSGNVVRCCAEVMIAVTAIVRAKSLVRRVLVVRFVAVWAVCSRWCGPCGAVTAYYGLKLHGIYGALSRQVRTAQHATLDTTSTVATVRDKSQIHNSINGVVGQVCSGR